MPDARVGHELQHGVQHAEPCTQDRHDHDIGADLLPRCGTERRLHADVAVGNFAHRFGGEQHADARGGATEMLGRRSLVAQLHQRVVHERMLDEVDRHGSTLYNFSSMRAQGSRQSKAPSTSIASRQRITSTSIARHGDVAGRRSRLRNRSLRRRARGGRARSGSAGSPARLVGGHRRHRRDTERGASGPESRRDRHRRRQHRRRRSPRSDCRALQRRRNDRCARRDRPARPGEHAHPRADGHVSGPGRRPRPDGLAPEVHLPGRSEDRVAGDGAHRHTPRRARDD